MYTHEPGYLVLFFATIVPAPVALPYLADVGHLTKARVTVGAVHVLGVS
jgi:hypothetical protein